MDKESKIFGLPLVMVFFAFLIILPIIIIDIALFEANRYQLQQVKDQVTVWQTTVFRNQEATTEAVILPSSTPSPTPKMVKPISTISGETK